MENTLLIQVINDKAIGLLRQLEQLELIKILEENIATPKPGLSEKYLGIISPQQGENLQKHIKRMRKEWSSI